MDVSFFISSFLYFLDFYVSLQSKGGTDLLMTPRKVSNGMLNFTIYTFFLTNFSYLQLKKEDS